MERRQRQSDGTWDGPRYGGNSSSAQHPPGLRPEAPRHGEAPPSVLYPGGPWESRPPYEGSGQRPRRDYTQQEHNEPLQHGGPQTMPQFRPLHPGMFPRGGSRPGVPPHGPVEQIGSQPRLPHRQPADRYGSDGLQAPNIPPDVSFSQHRAPEGLMHYNAPRYGIPEAGFQRRPQHMIHAMAHQDVSEHRQRSQDVGRRHDTMYQPGEQPLVQLHDAMYQPGERPSNVQRHDTMYQPGERPSNVQRHDTMYQPGERPSNVQLHDTMYQPGERPSNVQRHDTMYQPGERPSNVQLHDTMYQPGERPSNVQRHDTMYQPGERPSNVQRHDTMYQPGEQLPVQRHDTMYQPGERLANVQPHAAMYQPGEQPPTIQHHESMYQPREKPANVQIHNAVYQPEERPPTVQLHDPMYQSGERPNVQCHVPTYQSGEQPPNVQLHDTIYQLDERPPNVQRHGVPQLTSGEHKDPMYSEHTQPRSEKPEAYQPAVFHQGGPNSFRGLDPALAPYGGQQPYGFQHDNRSNMPLPYQNEGSQPGLHNLRSPPVPDTFSYRAPSPGIQQISNPLQPVPTQNSPCTDNPQQGHYHLPPVHGRQPNPSYTFPTLEGSAFNGSFKEEDLEDLRFQRSRSHPQHLLEQQQSVTHQDIRQGPDPPVPLGMAGDRYFEQDVPFPQQEVTDRRDPHLLLQHGVPFVPQSTTHSEESIMHLDRHTELENNGPSDKDVFMHWLSGFLSCRRKTLSTKPVAVQTCSIAEARGLIYGALQLVSQLDSLCQALESNNKAGEPRGQDYEKAAGIRVDLEKRLKELEKPGYIQGVKMKLNRVHKKRLRWQRRKQVTEEEEKVSAERSAEKEASIDQWRMQCIQKVEEKKRERELKATADSVLGEVRKKQNDVKKMLDVLKALEKLRKLRKEAAGRKGVHPPPSADETFANHIKRLRTMVHKRSALYDAEEKTLRVILEGEQEEERQREKDKRQRKEKEKILQKQRELDSILFGDTEPLPALHPLLPFRQYYLQAEHSVVSLVKIRHEWDQFLVPPDHPDGSSIPRGWVVPTVPSNDTWASALKPSD
ncbi:programmed cell death protein 7 [Hyla sarda]|uniref:programmed cell death protein 7 n=1 Tax=Hyla sarda TaxID=327740 RepID=UPI0024C24674|nr:programmed cell death protein 7 [Hyla sarda]